MNDLVVAKFRYPPHQEGDLSGYVLSFASNSYSGNFFKDIVRFGWVNSTTYEIVFPRSNKKLYDFIQKKLKNEFIVFGFENKGTSNNPNLKKSIYVKRPVSSKSQKPKQTTSRKTTRRTTRSIAGPSIAYGRVKLSPLTQRQKRHLKRTSKR